MAEQATYAVIVLGVRQQFEQQPPVLLLRDELDRTLEITIGLCEALAIQLALNGTVVGRPLTHDLLLSIAEHLDTPVERVIIDDVSNNTYYARLILATPDGPVSLDCRPSDGIAVALRAHVPIEATDAVMAGGEPDAGEEQLDLPE